MRYHLPIMLTLLTVAGISGADAQTYPVVDTGQTVYYDATGKIAVPGPGQPFAGQDAAYPGNAPSYMDNGDGTITDNVTGLMWQEGFEKSNYGDAAAHADTASTGGYDDWRVPTIKELYSLILFTGNQGSGPPEATTPPADAEPFIDTDSFPFEYPSAGRYIDAQYLTSTEYVDLVMGGRAAFFGVNFADGRIKGYPQSGGIAETGEGRYYLRLVRGNPAYGENAFVANDDGTITDEATGLMWMQVDTGDPAIVPGLSGFIRQDGTMNWEEALAYADTATWAGYDDWRLPDAKELHSLVDYGRSPAATGSAAIDPLFDATVIENEAGADDYGFYWTSTTFEPGTDAVYISFGRALGYLDLGFGAGFYDVHGAGAQRTDPKTGSPSYGWGPQGDVRRVYNLVRLVRNADDASVGAGGVEDGPAAPATFRLVGNHPNPFNPVTAIDYVLFRPAPVRLEVFNLRGQSIRTLVDAHLAAGRHRVFWDATDSAGNRVASGGYLCRLELGGRAETSRMLLVR